MKLKSEQVRAEKEKFLAWYQARPYAHEPCVKDFQIWLACREANNEITLNIALCGHDSGYKRVYNQAIEDVKEIIESQGYEVVTK